MSLDRPGACLKGIHFAGRVLCRGILMGTPVVQDLGDMVDLLCHLCAAEDKVIILRPVKSRVKPSHLLQNIPLHQEKMAEIIGGMQQIFIVIRLKMRLEKFFPLHVHFILMYIACVLGYLFKARTHSYSASGASRSSWSAKPIKLPVAI